MAIKTWLGGLALAAMAATALAAPGGASAVAAATVGSVAVGPHGNRVVSTFPKSTTPAVLNGSVQAMASVNGLIVLGGTFTSASNPGSSTAITRTKLLAFDPVTGIMSATFAPSVTGGDVLSLAAAPDGHSVYAVGTFTAVNGVAGRVMKIDVPSGNVASNGWVSPTTNGRVWDVRVSGNRVFIAGAFGVVNGSQRSLIAALNPLTGALDRSLGNLVISGIHNSGVPWIRRIDVSPDGTRMVITGNFRYVGTALRDQIAMLDITVGHPVALTDWQTSRFSDPCSAWAFDTVMRGVAFSPDSTYFIVTTTGGPHGASTLCDSASRWETNRSGAGQNPTWVDWSGGDTFYAVSITGAVAYVGGHFRWLDNPYGSDSQGSGGIARPGIAALDVRNGLPIAWNPTRARGIGVFAFLPTATGLYVGSDTTVIDGVVRPRVAFLPLIGGFPMPKEVSPALPAGGTTGTLWSLGAPGASTASRTSNGGSDAARAFTLTAGADGSLSVAAASSAAPASTVAPWGSWARAGFVLDGVLYTAWVDGSLRMQTVSSTGALGAAAVVATYNDTVLAADVARMTSMWYSNGTLYYTLSGDTVLHRRSFTPNTMALGGPKVGSLPLTSSALAPAGTGWDTVRGAVLSSGSLLIVDGAGRLLQTGWTDAGLLGLGATGGNVIVVSDPATGGTDLSSRVLVVAPSATGR